MVWRTSHWHPEGTQIAANIRTNGIALVDHMGIVGEAFPDQASDDGVGFLWIDHRLFTKTGHFFEIRPRDYRFKFSEIGSPEFGHFAWNAHVGAVVGTIDGGLASFDPVARKVVYREFVPGLGPLDLHWSVDGRFAARQVPNVYGDVQVFDGDTGKLHATVHVPADMYSSVDVACGPNGLFLLFYKHRGHSKVSVFRREKELTSFDLGAQKTAKLFSHIVSERGVWSPSGDRFALLLEGAEVQVRDTHSGGILSTFVGPSPKVPNDVAEWYKESGGSITWFDDETLLRFDGHFVGFWNTRGAKLAEFVVQ